MTQEPPQPGRKISFQERARQRRPGLLRELWGFVRLHRKWWLIPIFLALLMTGALLALGGSAAAPFIYPLF